MRTTALALILLAGCGSPEDAGAPEPVAKPDAGTISRSQFDLTQSGTRIKARVGVTPDGAKMFLGWRDTVRGEDCYFETAADGKKRCLPSGVSLANSYFSDQECTDVVADFSVSTCPDAGRRYVSMPLKLEGCSYVKRLRLVGPEHTGDVYIVGPYGCQKAARKQDYSYFIVGSEVPPAEFVEMTEQLDD